MDGPTIDFDIGHDLSAADRTLVSEIIVSNVGSAVRVNEGAAELLVGQGAKRYWRFDTDSGEIRASETLDPGDPGAATVTIRPAVNGLDADSGVFFAQVAMDGGGNAGVFAARRWSLASNGWWIGEGSLPLIVIAEDEVVLAGLMTVGANRNPASPAPGPGGAAGAASGGTPGRGTGGGETGAGDAGGGGGASFGGSGGLGGDASSSVGGAAGKTYGTPELMPLIGGSGGGAGGGTRGLAGGNGGGALQITAGRRISVALGGAVDARGGGAPGARASTIVRAGGGGGAGGAILLEAPEVQLLGPVGANGGAGGSAIASNQGGEAGSPGQTASAPALGPPGTSAAGPGGDGSDAVGAGGASTAASSGGGGGGGGGGRIRINTLTGTERYTTLPTIESGLTTVGVVATQ